MQQRLPMLFTSVAVGIIFAGASLVLIGSEAKARPVRLLDDSPVATIQPPNIAVTELVQSLAKETKMSEPVVRKYISKARMLHRDGKLRAGSDYMACAAIAEKGGTLEDAFFAHDMSICALSMGETRAKQLAAVSMDQILVRMGQKQRFGTIVKNGKVLPVSKEVSDATRLLLGLPSIIVAEKLAKSGKPFVANDLNNSGLAMMLKPTPVAVAIAE